MRGYGATRLSRIAYALMFTAQLLVEISWAEIILQLLVLIMYTKYVRHMHVPA